MSPRSPRSVAALTHQAPGLPLAPTAPLYGQDPGTPGPIPPALQERIVTFLNDPSVPRVSGPTRIPAGTRMEGPLAVLGGPVTIGGEVGGTLMVVNGDLTLSPGARIDGDLYLVGGRLLGSEGAEILGVVVSYPAPLRYQLRAGQVTAAEPTITEGPFSTDLGFGEARFMLYTGDAYNRVEGLPVHFGPRIETRGRNPTRFDVLGIWRSTDGLTFNLDDLGYTFRLRQGVGGRGAATLGVDAYSVISPVEGRGMSDLESSLSTFFRRDDLRDHFERIGWEGYVELRPAQLPFRARVGYREEKHAFAPVGGPWSLGDNERPWRPQPLVAEGRSRSVEGTVYLDTRNDPVEPTDGWWVEGRFSRLVGGNLEWHGTTTGVDPYTNLLLDLRHYARVSPTSRLNLRGFLAGSISGDPLPPQHQRVLGGAGSLPAHPRFSVDCGARSAVVPLSEVEPNDNGERSGYGNYGCDRVVLFQAEFRGPLPFSFEPPRREWGDWEWRSLLSLQPAWALFLNAGRGWVADGGPEPLFPRVDAPARADVGAGLFIGPVGAYWAYPLNRNERGHSFFIRFQQRF